MRYRERNIQQAREREKDREREGKRHSERERMMKLPLAGLML